MKNKVLIIFLVMLVLAAGIAIIARIGINKPNARPESASFLDATAAAGGFGHTLAIKGDRTVWAWGLNEYGQLGDGTTDNRDTAMPIASLTDIIAVAGGFDHSMALAADGAVWAWGSNEYGQLGDETTYRRTVPAEVTRLPQAQAIAAGRSHSLALMKDGTVWGWGANDVGQLGNGTTGKQQRAGTVNGISNVVAIASGRDHSVALKVDGTVWTWGGNTFGQLGDGTTKNRTSAAQVAGLTDIVAIACGYDHTVALRSDGTVWSWGANDSGQLGDGTLENRREPVQVMGISEVMALSAGHRHTLALLKNGKVKAWGSNLHYQLGRLFTIQTAEPVEITGFNNTVTSVASGGYHVIAIAGDHTLRSWGHNKFGQLGNSTRDYQRAPVPALFLSGSASLAKKDAEQTNSGGKTSIVMTACGRSHSAALLDDGTVWAWGDNFYGQLGDVNRRVNRSLPQPVPGISNVTAVSAGNGFTLALKRDGTVWAWGYNELRQLGDGSKVQSRVEPVQVEGLTGVVGISTSGFVSLAIKKDGTVWTWGLTFSGGENTPSPAPAQVAGLASIIAVSSGHKHYLALAGDGTVWSYGNNEFGQLGDGTAVERHNPVRVANLTDVVAVAAGTRHSIALKKDGTLWAWGSILEGKITNLLDNSALTPVQHSGLVDIVAIAAGDGRSVALKRDGSILNCFWRIAEQAGSDAAASGHLAIAISGLSEMTQLSIGERHMLGVKKDGTLWAWGSNEYGQLGDGSDVSSGPGAASPHDRAAGRPAGRVREFAYNPEVRTAPSGNNIASLSTGGAHSALLMADGTVWTWGDNSYSQLGIRSDRTINGRSARAASHAEIPFPLSGQTGIKAVDAGPFHSLAVKNDGTVIEWGRSYDDVIYEQQYEKRLGSMGVSDWIQHSRDISSGRARPGKAMNNPVGELGDVMAVSSGSGFSLALKQDGTVWAWGVNAFGQLGDGTTVSRKVPKPVNGLTEIVAISAGDAYSLALQGDGTVWAWGVTAYKIEGKKMVPHITAAPVHIPDMADVASIAAGFEPLALLRDGSVHTCWQKVRPDPKIFIPARITEIDNAQAISAKGMQALVLGTNGHVTVFKYSWKGNNDGSMESLRVTEPFEELSDAVVVSAGVSHSLATKRDGSLWVWGINESGQLGDATKIHSTAPIPVRFL